MERVYNPKEIEQKWQKIWDDRKGSLAAPTIIQTEVLAAGRVPLSVRTGAARWTSSPVYGAGYRCA